MEVWRARIVDLVDALAESCDIYFYNMALLLEPDRIAEVARDFELGGPTGIDLPYEKAGLISTKA
jgi:penicillin-binding protein 2